MGGAERTVLLVFDVRSCGQFALPLSYVVP